ncbi:programmed cell death protein 2 [Scheffersomyces amazonensis]|uniref:programmed cell death protein 2 n=1 Tax=Scheffersomyces amazonensis TaxID=1078765 RepID=UPI00315D6060
MSSHDEYSSDEEELFDENENSEVYLGFVDGPIIDDEEDPEDNELPTIEDTFIGGKPVWLHPESRPDESVLTCPNCNQKLALLLQAFAPIDGKLYDRVIYIFACKNTSQCSRKSNTVKVIRGISQDPSRVSEIKKEQDEAIKNELNEKLRLEDKKKFNIEITKDLFNTDKDKQSSNPFGNSSNPFASSSTSNPFSADSNPFAKKEEPKKEVASKESYAKIASKNAPAKKEKKKSLVSDNDLPSYKGNFVYVDIEKFKKETLDPELEKYKHLIEKGEADSNDPEDNIGSSGKSRRESSSGASIEASSVLDDKFFAAFTERVKHNPNQVLRYNIGGRPLLYSGKDDIAKRFVGNTFNVPNPGYNPSSNRQFELQLMPKAIMDLEEIEDNKDTNIASILNGMSWGTIIVCTDVEDYVPKDSLDENHVAYIEEWCGVQWEDSV